MIKRRLIRVLWIMSVRVEHEHLVVRGSTFTAVALVVLAALLSCSEAAPPAALHAFEERAASSALGDGCGPNSEVWPEGLEESDLNEMVPNSDPSGVLELPALDTIGTISGGAAVDQGIASYAIDIEVPPGRAGVQPRLTLRYSSGAGNDLAGVGWTLNGVRRIHRCPRDQARDGIARPVSFTNDDRLCLGGSRLVRVAGSHTAKPGPSTAPS